MSLEAAILSHAIFVEEDDRLGHLFEAHHQRLYGLARRLGGDAEEARDLVQESYLRAARHLPRLPREASGAEAWLVRTLVNLCRDRHRRGAVRRRAAETVLAEPPETLDTEEPLVARAAVHSALAALDPKRRAVIVLRELEGHPTREVARLLGITPVTARWHLAKARKQLAEILLREEKEERS